MQDKGKNTLLHWYLSFSSTAILTLCVWILTTVVDHGKVISVHTEQIKIDRETNSEKHKEQDQQLTELRNRVFILPEEIKIKKQ